MNINVFEGKTKEDALTLALKELKCDESDIIYRHEEVKGGLFKGSQVKLSAVKLKDIQEFIKQYLKEVLSQMELEVNFEAKIRDSQITIKMYSDNNAILIGRNGQTLKALQMLIKQAVHKETRLYPYILLDVENYKDKQIYHLERLAKNIAKEVLRTKVEVKMNDMNSYERRIVHNVLTNFKGITTFSEGEEPNRHIVIKPAE